MTTEANKEAARRIPLEIFNDGKFELIDELVSPDFVDHAYSYEGLGHGREGIRNMATMLRSAFPDFHYTLEDELADGDKVIHRVRAKGTHQGHFMGFAPTGKQVEWTETHIGRFADGKLAEHWANIDQWGLMRQLGVMPTMEQPTEEQHLDEGYYTYE